MVRRSVESLGFAILVGAALLVGPGTSRAGGNEWDRRNHELALKLARMDDADSRAAAALLFQVGDTQGSDATELMAEAVALAPGRADLVWLQASVCSNVRNCDPELIEQQLRILAPANGSGWLGALNRAYSAGDTAGVDASLKAIAKSARTDLYYTTLVARLTRAAARAGVLTLQEAEVEIIGVLAARVIPAYSPAVTSCKEARLTDPQVIEACRGVAKSFLAGDTYLTEMVGVAIAKHVWPENSPEWKAAVDAHLAYDSAAKEFLKTRTAQAEASERYLELCEQYAKEQDVYRAAIRESQSSTSAPVEKAR